MKLLIIICLFLFPLPVIHAQKLTNTPINGRCGLIHPKKKYIPDAQRFLDSIRNSNPNQVLDFTTPYLIKIFVRIFRNNNGTNPATTRDSVVDRVAQMNDQYANHGICFMLVGIDDINDTYANSQMTNDNLLDSEYGPYLRDNYALPGVVTLFVHNVFVASGSSGNAYDTPNSFLSIAGWAANSDNVNSIYGHEMGHCLGLVHTFQTWPDRDGQQISENVTRNAGNSCFNCIVQGDFCCDTPADFANSQNNVDSNCIFTGNQQDNCNASYNPNTVNIMSYMPWNCISITGSAITANQATRMHATVNDIAGPIYDRVATDNLTINISEIINSGMLLRGTRTNLIYNAVSVTHQFSVSSYNVAGNSITVMPGANFVPSSNGLVEFRIQTVCQ